MYHACHHPLLTLRSTPLRNQDRAEKRLQQLSNPQVTLSILSSRTDHRNAIQSRPHQRPVQGPRQGAARGLSYQAQPHRHCRQPGPRACFVPGSPPPAYGVMAVVSSSSRSMPPQSPTLPKPPTVCLLPRAYTTSILSLRTRGNCGKVFRGLGAPDLRPAGSRSSQCLRRGLAVPSCSPLACAVGKSPLG